VSEVAGLGANVYGADKDTVDVTDPAAVASLVERTGPVDVLVNNARGVAGQVHHPVEDITDEDWRAVVDANLTSTFVCTRAVVAGMKAAGGIAVNCIAPGFVLSNPTSELRRGRAAGTGRAHRAAPPRHGPGHRQRREVLRLRGRFLDYGAGDFH
jgi:NAD(P)-dependent dehydrogenase (short-subunit alcohol dehydrogenase family)